MFTSKLRLIAKARPSRASTTSTDSGLDCKDETPKCKTLSANINKAHQSSGTVSYADALIGPQSPKSESLAGDIDNEPQSSKTASLSTDPNDEPQLLQPPKRSTNSISFRPVNRQSDRRHINPWIATLQYRVSALVNSIEIAQANALPFRSHKYLGEPLPFVMDMTFAASLVRSNMHLVAEWIRELQMRGSRFIGLEDIVNRLYFFCEHWGVRNHDPQLVGRIQRLISYLVD